MRVTTVVIPAAGYGTRFLPYTKSIPKEMVPLIDVPALHVITQEARHAGAAHVCLVMSKEKTSIPDYFSTNAQLNQFLEKKNALSRIDSVNELMSSCTISYVIQEEARGLGHAILMAQNQIHDPYFGVMLPDDIILNQPSALQQMIDCAQAYQASVIAVCEVDPHQVSSYGIIRPGKQLSDDVVTVTDLVEKPHPSQAPSNLAIVGRYVLSKKVFSALETSEIKPNSELQLTDAIASLIHTYSEPVIALKIKGTRFDIGTPLGWLQATMHLAFEHPAYGSHLRSYARAVLDDHAASSTSAQIKETTL